MPPVFDTHSFFKVPSSTSSQQAGNRVPPHDELMMPDTQCRMCGRSFAWPHHRRRHEVEFHRLSVINGEFYSQTPYVMPLSAASIQSSSSAQPLTPAQPIPVTTLQNPPVTPAQPLPVTTPTPQPPPVTQMQPPVVTPTPAISVVPLPATPALTPVQPQSVSPAQMSVGSQGSTPPPALFLTPTPPVSVAGLARSSTTITSSSTMPQVPRLRAASSSPLARPQRTRLPTMAPLPQQSSSPVSSSPSQMALGSASTTGSTGSPSGSPLPVGLRRSSTRAASSSPVSRGPTAPRAASASPLARNIQQRSPQTPANKTCRYCLHEFSTVPELNRHIQHGRCRFQYDPATHNLNEYCVLRRPANYNRQLAILSKLTLPDQIEMCQLNNWAIPKLWPLVFPGQHRQRGRIPLILREMTAGNRSTDILRELLRCSPQVCLPKQIILMDDSADIQSVLQTGIITPGNTFITRISGDHIMVSSGRY